MPEFIEFMDWVGYHRMHSRSPTGHLAVTGSPMEYMSATLRHRFRLASVASSSRRHDLAGFKAVCHIIALGLHGPRVW